MKALILIVMVVTLNRTITVKSKAFSENDFIPVKHSCEGSNINPPLTIGNIPEETKSLALIVEDPDAKVTFDHWLMWNIPVQEKIEEDSNPGIQGKNGKGDSRYTGPCPPSGTHHYHFKVYALNTNYIYKIVCLFYLILNPSPQEKEAIGLFYKYNWYNTKLDLPEGTNKAELLKAMSGHIVTSGELIGLFKK